MNPDMTSTGNFSRRFRELQEKFSSLEPRIENSETKEALSVMSGMVQEIWRHINKKSSGDEGQGIRLKDIAEMYHNAPSMNGSAMNKPLTEGTKAPDFSLKDANGDSISLFDFRGSPVMLVFYPLDWSPGCSQQLDLYEHEMTEFEKRGVKILAISVDSIYSHGAWSAVRNISFPLLSDFNPKGEVAKKYNVYREPDGFTERALYVIDREGIIRYGFVSEYLHHIPDIYQLFGKLDEVFTTQNIY